MNNNRRRQEEAYISPLLLNAITTPPSNQPRPIRPLKDMILDRYSKKFKRDEIQQLPEMLQKDVNETRRLGFRIRYSNR